MTGRGKRLTILTVFAGLAVLVVAGYIFRERAIEQWYIWRLNSEDEETREASVVGLGQMVSAKTHETAFQVSPNAFQSPQVPAVSRHRSS